MQLSRSFTPDEIAEIARAKKRNRWVAWESVAHAEARRGPVTDSLHLKLQDGRELKFLWLRVDQAMNAVAEAAARHLGDRFSGLAER